MVAVSNLLEKVLEFSLNILFWILVTYYLTRNLSLQTEQVTEYLGGIESVTKNYNYRLQYAILSTMPTKVVFFYSNLLYFSSFLFRRNYLQYASLLVGFVALLLLLEFITISSLCDRECFFNYFLLGVLLYGFYTVVSLLYRFIKEYFREQRLKKELYVEKTNAEMTLLRSQINPHFLFNALNNLFYIAEKGSQTEVSTGIAQLSDLLRYLLYDNSQDFVPLEKEIEFIDNYINLNKLRFDRNDDIDISFSIIGETKDVMIPPALLISFVENAFKHGLDIYTKSYIHIEIHVEDGSFQFQIKNSTPPAQNEVDPLAESQGLGLENVRKRLQIIYPNKHLLRIASAETYSVNLVIER